MAHPRPSSTAPNLTWRSRIRGSRLFVESIPPRAFATTPESCPPPRLSGSSCSAPSRGSAGYRRSLRVDGECGLCRTPRPLSTGQALPHRSARPCRMLSCGHGIVQICSRMIRPRARSRRLARSRSHHFLSRPLGGFSVHWRPARSHSRSSRPGERPSPCIHALHPLSGGCHTGSRPGWPRRPRHPLLGRHPNLPPARQ